MGWAQRSCAASARREEPAISIHIACVALRGIQPDKKRRETTALPARTLAIPEQAPGHN